MKIVYLYNKLSGGVGDSVQGNLLAHHLNAIEVSSSIIMAREGGYVEVDGGDYIYPCRSILAALNQLEPDIVFVHTFTPHLTQELQKIAQRFIMVVRLAVNFEELIVVPNPVSMLPHLWMALRQFDCIIAPSQWVKDNLNALGFDNVVYIPTCVDGAKFPVAEGRDNNILSVGRVGPIKNHIIPILAYGKVRREVPSARLALVGSGPLLQQYRQMLQGMAAMGIGGLDGIQLVGSRSSFPFYKTGKVYVQASFSENGSLTMLEALTSGLPCVVSNVGGHLYESDAVKFVRHDDVVGFADTIIDLLTDDNEWRRLHKMAMVDVQQYDVSQVIPQYEELFERLMTLQRFKQK